MAGAKERRADASGSALDHRLSVGGLRCDDRRYALLENTGLLGRDLAQGIAEEIGMVERDRRYRRNHRAIDHVGRVEPAAETDLEQDDIRRNACEGKEGSRRGDLEERDRTAGIDPLHLAQQFAEQSIVDDRTGDADSLVETYEMRRGVDMSAVAGSLRHRAQIGDGRTLA